MGHQAGIRSRLPPAPGHAREPGPQGCGSYRSTSLARRQPFRQTTASMLLEQGGRKPASARSFRPPHAACRDRLLAGDLPISSCASSVVSMKIASASGKSSPSDRAGEAGPELHEATDDGRMGLVDGLQIRTRIAGFPAGHAQKRYFGSSWIGPKIWRPDRSTAGGQFYKGPAAGERWR